MKTRNKRNRTIELFVALLVTFAGLTTAIAHELTAGALKIDHPWSRATPGGAKVGAGYLTIQNTGNTADRLIDVKTNIAERSEIHEMAMDGGIMRMRRLAKGLELPAGGTVALKPGGYHLMFINLKDGIKKGEPFKATVVFEKAGPVELEFRVEAIGATPKNDATKGSSHGAHKPSGSHKAH